MGEGEKLNRQQRLDLYLRSRLCVPLLLKPISYITGFCVKRWILLNRCIVRFNLVLCAERWFKTIYFSPRLSGVFFYFILFFLSRLSEGGDLRAGFSKWAPSSLRREIKNEQNQQKKKKPPRIYHGGIIPHRAALQIS